MENAPATLNREKAYVKVNKLRSFRNKVFHHYAIFDKSPVDEHQNAMHVIGWASPVAVNVVKAMGNPREVAKKPKRWP